MADFPPLTMTCCVPDSLKCEEPAATGGGQQCDLPRVKKDDGDEENFRSNMQELVKLEQRQYQEFRELERQHRQDWNRPLRLLSNRERLVHIGEQLREELERRQLREQEALDRQLQQERGPRLSLLSSVQHVFHLRREGLNELRRRHSQEVKKLDHHIGREFKKLERLHDHALDDLGKLHRQKLKNLESLHHQRRKELDRLHRHGHSRIHRLKRALDRLSRKSLKNRHRWRRGWSWSATGERSSETDSQQGPEESATLQLPVTATRWKGKESDDHRDCRKVCYVPSTYERN